MFPSNSVYIIALSSDVGLADLRYDIEDFIHGLDFDSSPLQKNWKDVAKRFKVSPEDIQYLAKENNKLGGSAIRLLIEKLGSVCMSLKEFVDVLQELERHDVANDILKWFKNNKSGEYQVLRRIKDTQEFIRCFINIMYRLRTVLPFSARSSGMSQINKKKISVKKQFMVARRIELWE